MQEEMNKAMAQLNETVGDDVPIAQGGAATRSRRATPRPRRPPSCSETSVESRILEVEQATANVEAQSRLSQLRAELGLDPAETATPIAAPTAEPAAEPVEQAKPATSS